MGQVVIRRAVETDLAGVIALLDEVDDLHRRALPWLLRQIDGTNQTQFLEPYVSKDDHAMFLAVAADGSLAGVLYLFLRQPARAPIVRPTLVAEIDTLVVKASCRRQGLGKRLVEAALCWANTSGPLVPNLAFTSSTSQREHFGHLSVSTLSHVAWSDIQKRTREGRTSRSGRQ
jgi:GNAT superfamily N-acetyltransferase